MRSLKDTARGAFLAAGVTAAAALGALGVTATPAEAQGCRSSSYIPGLSPLVLQRADGATVALQRDSRNYRPTAHVWVNGAYAGQHDVPFELAGGEVRVLLRTGHRLETWMGGVRQALKPIPYVVVCGDWFGDLR